MKDADKTKDQLISELGEARLRISELDELREEHERVEKGLRESEERFRAVFETAQDSIFMKDRSLRYVLVNPCVEQLFGLPALKLVGLTDKDLFGAEIAERIWKEDHRVLAGETLEVEHSKPVNGELHTFNIIRVPLRDSSGNITGLCGIARDVTVRRRNEENLRLFKSLVDQANDALFVVDRDTGRLLEVNDRACGSLGYTREELLGKTVMDMEASMPDGFSWGNHVEAVRKTGQMILEGTHKRKDGSTFPAEVSVKYITLRDKDFIVAVARDITGRKKADQALRETNARLKALIHTIPDIIYFKDINRRHAVVNSAFESMVGKKAGEITGKTDKDVFPPDMARQCTRNDNRVFSTRKPFRLEESALGKDGKRLYFDTIKTPLHDERGEIAGLVSVCRDITGRKVAEESLRESNERIRNLAVHLQSIQEEERKRIARDIHDEFGQVLTALKYDLSWVVKNMPEDNVQMIETSKKMSKLIDHAVKTVQRISSDLRPALLDELGLAAAFEWFGKEYQLRTGVKCRIICDTDETALDKDLSTALFRAFQEALTNVSRHAGATRVNVSLNEHSGKLVFKVADNGRGITKKDINNPRSYGLIGIKERFYPWGGEVDIKGVKGKGTTVSVRVPLANVNKSLQ